MRIITVCAVGVFFLAASASAFAAGNALPLKGDYSGYFFDDGMGANRPISFLVHFTSPVHVGNFAGEMKLGLPLDCRYDVVYSGMSRDGSGYAFSMKKSPSANSCNNIDQPYLLLTPQGDEFEAKIIDAKGVIQRKFIVQQN